MSLSKIFVNNTQITSVDENPISNSKNLIESGGVKAEFDSKIDGLFSEIGMSDYSDYSWYLWSEVGSPLTLNTDYNYTYAYKGLIPQGISKIEVYGKGSNAGRLWYTLDEQENLIRKGDQDAEYAMISLSQDEEKYIVAQTNNIGTNPGIIKFYNIEGVNTKIIFLQNEIQEVNTNVNTKIDYKIIHLAKWGSAGNPTDLKVGDIYTPNGIQILEVTKISEGIVTGYENVKQTTPTIYEWNNILFTHDGTKLINSIKCPQEKMPFGDRIILDINDTETSALKNITFNDSYGLYQGYYHDTYYRGSGTRVSTYMINACIKDVPVVLNSFDFKIRGIGKFDNNYKFLNYNQNVDEHQVILEKGYYYNVTFSKIDTDLTITPDEIAPYIYIGDRVELKQLKKNMESFSDYVYEVDSMAEANTWYMGSTIGETIQKITYGNCFSIKKSVQEGEIYILSAKGAGGRGWYLLDAEDKIVDCAPADFNDTIKMEIPSGVSYLIIQSNAGISYLYLSNPGKISFLETEVNNLESEIQDIIPDIEALKDNINDTFKCNTPFLWNKLSRLVNIDTGFVNIGIIGDSWTQGTENIIDGSHKKDKYGNNDFQSYIKVLTKMLQDEYGFGGLGWLDFSCDGGSYNRTMFGCAEMYERWKWKFNVPEGSYINGVDGAGGQSGDASRALGICCAHLSFGAGSSLKLSFEQECIDRFKIRFYDGASFTISINGGTATTVTAQGTTGWHEQEFSINESSTTDGYGQRLDNNIWIMGTVIEQDGHTYIYTDNIENKYEVDSNTVRMAKTVLITALVNDSIIFGMDCFYGTKGVRVHKIGNRSISASGYLAMNAEQWETGIAKLELCWASILLAINDLGSDTSESKMNAIVARISSLIDRLKIATDDGNGLVTCDINLLGVENIEASGWTGLGALAKKQRSFALTNGYGWCNTDKCIGSTKAEFVHNGTFSDTIHLNQIGSYAYGKNIYNSLFKF